MDEQTFLYGMQYLKSFYLDWSFDLTNKQMLKVWYEKLQGIDTNKFNLLIDVYTEQNAYPPKSPNDILAVAKKIYLKSEMTPDEAWNYVYELISSNSMNYHPEVIYEKLEAFPNVLETVKEMHYKLMNFTSSEASLVAKQFKTSYETKLNKYVETKTTKLIGGNNQKLLGE